MSHTKTTPKPDELNPTPDFSHIQQAWHEIIASTDDRTAAIMGAAVLDNLMERLLSRRMRDDKITRELFQFANNGVLSTAGGRIRVAYAIGFVGKMFYDDVTLVNRIRNRFAHDLVAPDTGNGIKPITFNSPSISKLCAEFKWAPNREPDHWPDAARDRFLRTAILLTNDMTREILDGPHDVILSQYCESPIVRR